MFRRRYVHQAASSLPLLAVAARWQALLRVAQNLGSVTGEQSADDNHRQSQKPADELYDSFRASFPELTTTTAASGPAHGSTSLADALDVAVPSRCVPLPCRSSTATVLSLFARLDDTSHWHRQRSSTTIDQIIIGDPNVAREWHEITAKGFC